MRPLLLIHVVLCSFCVSSSKRMFGLPGNVLSVSVTSSPARDRWMGLVDLGLVDLGNLKRFSLFFSGSRKCVVVKV